jgi:hypothetical protein
VSYYRPQPANPVQAAGYQYPYYPYPAFAAPYAPNPASGPMPGYGYAPTYPVPGYGYAPPTPTGYGMPSYWYGGQR